MIEQPEQKQSRWSQDSILIKLGVIIILILLLLIPSSWIQGLITDREGYQQKMFNSVADKWAGSQLIQGPVLLLPYTETGAKSKSDTHKTIGTLYLLPRTLQIKGFVKSTSLHKGIYDATGYSSNLSISGDFNKPDLAAAGIDPSAVLYDQARLVFSISDMKGLKSSPVVNLQGHDYTADPTIDDDIPFDKGLQVSFPLQKDQGLTYSYQLDLKGSNDLNFLQTGKTTEVEIKSDWTSPDFGTSLPDDSIINDKGFSASWHKLYYSRPFPQQWLNNNQVLLKNNSAAIFGVKLQLPIDQYRKIMRTTKYSTLIILLTFVSLFLTEMIKKQRIHLFNYTLIGAAMVVYYTLLLSFSEQIGYNYAYLLSSVSTIALIAVFTASLLKNRAVAALFAFILSFFYGFIFIIIQLEELSLLFGSVALFLIVATLMYFSGKINWDKH